MISIEYFGILILSVITYWLIPKQSLRNLLLVLSSLGFICMLDKWSAVVVVGLTIVNYGFGILINQNPTRGWIHTLSVFLVLGVLVLFKYLGLLSGIYNSLAGFISALPSFKVKELLLPLGISYIIFKHISYLTDIKWGLVKPGRFLDFLLYSSLFTVFVAGPIERWERLKPQIEQPKIAFSWSNIDYGFGRIVQDAWIAENTSALSFITQRVLFGQFRIGIPIMLLAFYALPQVVKRKEQRPQLILFIFYLSSFVLLWGSSIDRHQIGFLPFAVPLISLALAQYQKLLKPILILLLLYNLLFIFYAVVDNAHDREHVVARSGWEFPITLNA